MSIKESFIIEMQRETATTKRLLERLNQDHWTWKPHEKSMSTSALANILYIYKHGYTKQLTLILIII